MPEGAFRGNGLSRSIFIHSVHPIARLDENPATIVISHQLSRFLSSA